MEPVIILEKQALTLEETILEKVKTLSPERQQQVLDFIEFLQVKNDLKPEAMLSEDKFKHPDGTLMSAYEAAKQWAGCVDSGLGDLSTNKTLLEEMKVK